MAEPMELIVEFERGVKEDDARAVATKVGATVRRRMRTDHDDQVMLLVRLEPDRFDRAKSDLSSDRRVRRVEDNRKDYGAL
jgi:hypothetical protein